MKVEGNLALVRPRLGRLNVLGFAVSGPARVLPVNVPAVNRVAAASKAGKNILVGIADGDFATLLDINVVAGKSSVVVFDHGGIGKRKASARTDNNAAAHLGEVPL